MSWRDFPYHKPSVPKPASGGIKAQSRRGGFGASWWARRWIAVLEGFDLGARLDRGRSYARRGQVLDIQIGNGRITAQVQGSRAQPYAVEITVKTLSPADQAKLGAALAGQALFAAKLLAGEMPQDIEQALEGSGITLFPARHADLKTECSCPDWSNPCKHIAAVYYLMGEEFDRDPFLIFALRGIDRGRLTALLGAGVPGSGKRPPRAAPAEARAPVPEPIDPSAPAFWNGTEPAPGWLGQASTPALAAAPLKRLGSLRFWRSDERLLDALAPVYARAATRAQAVLLGGGRDDWARGAAPAGPSGDAERKPPLDPHSAR